MNRGLGIAVSVAFCLSGASAIAKNADAMNDNVMSIGATQVAPSTSDVVISQPLEGTYSSNLAVGLKDSISGARAGGITGGMPGGSKIAGSKAGGITGGMPGGSKITGVKVGGITGGMPGGSKIAGSKAGGITGGMPGGSKITGLKVSGITGGMPGGG